MLKLGPDSAFRWEFYRRRRSLGNFAFDLQQATMQLDKLVGQVEAKSSAFVGMIDIVANLYKRLKNFGQLVGGDALASIGDLEDDASIVGESPHRHLAQARRVFDGVGQQIKDDLL